MHVGVQLPYVVPQHIKLVYITSGCNACLNLDDEMTANAPSIDVKLNLKSNQDQTKHQNHCHTSLRRHGQY